MLESTVEEAVLSWFAELGYGVAHGEVAPKDEETLQSRAAETTW